MTSAVFITTKFSFVSIPQSNYSIPLVMTGTEMGEIQNSQHLPILTQALGDVDAKMHLSLKLANKQLRSHNN